MAPTTTGPMVRFGTKRPSMTSMWRRSAPPASTRAMSSASAAKSADRIDGAIFMALSFIPHRSRASEAGYREAVRVVPVRAAAEHPVGVERRREAGRRVEPEVGPRRQQRARDVLVFFRFERAGRVHE